MQKESAQEVNPAHRPLLIRKQYISGQRLRSNCLKKWIEKDHKGPEDDCNFVSCSDDGTRFLLKGKAFAPVLVDISGYILSPLDDSPYTDFC